MMSKKTAISRFGCERLVLEIFRQAIYDWHYREHRSDISQFLHSEWAEELASIYQRNPIQILYRLEKEMLCSKDFHAAYRLGESRQLHGTQPHVNLKQSSKPDVRLSDESDEV